MAEVCKQVADAETSIFYLHSEWRAMLAFEVVGEKMDFCESGKDGWVCPSIQGGPSLKWSEAGCISGRLRVWVGVGERVADWDALHALSPPPSTHHGCILHRSAFHLLQVSGRWMTSLLSVLLRQFIQIWMYRTSSLIHRDCAIKRAPSFARSLKIKHGSPALIKLGKSHAEHCKLLLF